MKTLPVGEFKANFSEVLKEVQSGEEVVITYGKNKKSVAAIVPIESYKPKNKVKLGLLKNEPMVIHDDFAMSEEELLEL